MVGRCCWGRGLLPLLVLAGGVFIGAACFAQEKAATEKKAGDQTAPTEEVREPEAKKEKQESPSLLSVLKEALEESIPKALRPKLAEGDDEGYELYQQMIRAMRKADSLFYESRYTIKGKGDFSHGCTYRAWLKKPNYFRVEGETDSGKKGGILVGDGKRLWIYWPEGRPFVDEDSEADKKTRLTSYMTKRAPLAAHSIGHEVVYLGIGMAMPVIDPSTFHGYTDSLQAYLDGVTKLPAEKVGDEECDHILVNIMKHQRSWEIWVSKKDHLPRKMKQIVRVSYDLVMTEDWSEIKLNGEISNDLFAWKPPDDWTEWRMPSIESGLLKPGTEAPDFELDSVDGGKIKLSDLRGSVVWIYVWRAG